jgi:hypothetical protein
MNASNIGCFTDRAFQQPEKERTHIAERLISSLAQTTDFDVELAWQMEMGKCLDETDSGAVGWVPWEDKNNLDNKSCFVYSDGCCLREGALQYVGL